MRRTVIAPWTEQWNKLYLLEASDINRILQKEQIDIFHIGSTAVPAIGHAKPTIDLLVVVREIGRVDLYEKEMAGLGYSCRGENGIAGRRYFTKGGSSRTHHVHMFEAGNINIKKHLDFKAYMLAHPKEAKQYGELKLALAEKFPDDIHLYQKAKEAFVDALIEKSVSYASERQNMD
ncbi:GrpB family protein [Paenibacillus sp. PL91]|uniref:GrpB family protein n=1 Tax=Paenibacillus sp. PL91 TaxID=2729538 RepID=UPI00145D8A96|nr:GrpB family protein [Paenibacillus sp. PL91]MBC9202378.1 GrpB family protein [Paenibacillus sp. PL91]